MALAILIAAKSGMINTAVTAGRTSLQSHFASRSPAALPPSFELTIHLMFQMHFFNPPAVFPSIYLYIKVSHFFLQRGAGLFGGSGTTHVTDADEKN